MEFNIGTIKHLGLQMYSTLPPVIGELVSNAWDADSPEVRIDIPDDKPLEESDEIIVTDLGVGMSDDQVRNAYLIVGRDRRAADGIDSTPNGRKIMGRKGIGKFSGFGIAGEIEIETVRDGETSRFVMNYKAMEEASAKKKIEMPPMPPSGTVAKGTKITLRKIIKFRNRKVDIKDIRRKLARRFSVIGVGKGDGTDAFKVIVNGSEITPEERDLQRLLEVDADGDKYLWSYDDVEIEPNTDWRVSGWIGALNRTNNTIDGIQRGIVIMARGKMVQEPFVFEATVGQQYALSYIVGELHAEFVDEKEDTVGTTRNSLVWDTEANAAFKKWGQSEVNRIAREWAEKRRADNERVLNENPLYKKFKEESNKIGERRVRKVADKLIKDVILNDELADGETQQKMIQLCLDFMQFDAFTEMAHDISEAELENVGKLVELFREWEIIESKEMMRVTQGRIETIRRLQNLIESNALEVPTLHNFLKEFPWVLDPRWSLVADEHQYSDMLRENFPTDDAAEIDDDRRIDFLCIRESDNLVVVEIKRPKAKVSTKQLDQIKDYVHFIRDAVSRTTDPAFKNKHVTGYLLCGDTADTYKVREGLKTLEKDNIYLRKYSDLLSMVEANHKDILARYDQLQAAKASNPVE